MRRGSDGRRHDMSDWSRIWEPRGIRDHQAISTTLALGNDVFEPEESAFVLTQYGARVRSHDANLGTQPLRVAIVPSGHNASIPRHAHSFQLPTRSGQLPARSRRNATHRHRVYCERCAHSQHARAANTNSPSHMPLSTNSRCPLSSGQRGHLHIAFLPMLLHRHRDLANALRSCVRRPAMPQFQTSTRK